MKDDLLYMGEIKLIQAVLFDLDGTLINTNQLIIDNFRHAFRAECDINPDDREKHFKI